MAQEKRVTCDKLEELRKINHELQLTVKNKDDEIKQLKGQQHFESESLRHKISGTSELP